MSAKRKTKVASFPVPQDRDECNTTIAMIGEARREVTRLDAEMNDAIEAIKARYKHEAAGFLALIDTGIRGVHAYCEANRAVLTNDGKVKTHKFLAGVVNWRKRPPSVRIRGVEAVIERIQSLGLTRFLRTKVEINKDALLVEPAAAESIAGVTIGSTGEDFVITPNETRLEEVA